MALALANLGVFGWHQGWVGVAPATAVPATLHPERLTLLAQGGAEAASVPAAPVAASAGASAGAGAVAGASAAASSAASAPPSGAAAASAAPGVAASAGAMGAASALSTASAASALANKATEPALACLEAGPFDEQRWVAAQLALRTLLPAGRWTESRQPVPGRWIVYMGRYGDAAALERKETELRRIPSIQFERVNAPPGLAPGLSLGAFEDAAGAQAALQRWAQRGIRTARVVNLVPPQSSVQVRVDRLPPDLQAQLLAQRNAALGKGFVSCKAAV
ncbi:MAG: hypothetical protein RJA98_2078 [Pseudomonadota bacterium]